MSDIELRGITKRYGRGAAPAVDAVSLTVSDGEFFVLLGPSGCGKTTLLRTIAGLEQPDAGAVVLGGRDVTALSPRRRELAMVFQGYAVFPHLTVAENIGFGLRMRKAPKAEVDAQVHHAASLVQLSDVLDRYPSALSGGQRQRVAVARAIAVQPSVLLMDEPLSNLDALLRMSFRSELKALAMQLRTTIVYVTHDQVEALSLGDRIAVMERGRIVQCGTPMEVYEQPASRFVAGFLGTPPMNLLHARAERRDGRRRAVLAGHDLGVEPPDTEDDDVLVGIRAEHLSVADGTGGLPAQVRVVEPLGSQLLVTAVVEASSKGEGPTVKVLTPTASGLAPGARIRLQPRADRLRWFDPGSGAALEVRNSTVSSA